MTDKGPPRPMFYSPRSIRSKKIPSFNPSSSQLLPKIRKIQRNGTIFLSKKLSIENPGNALPVVGELPPLKIGNRLFRESPIVSDRRDEETFDKDLFSIFNQIARSSRNLK